ncbi:hypothetical protein SERLA73DRAFT_189623 [Serpula lacrymans var. lacrymans S7.3]|uniref:Uncharacterized protein n=2 Tax=Serpula lacrymans var. lacrymans TaxID=341189 RepID=F8QE74_SERL3|nr:uncharacterized protein SERLADRAFT_480493 [Serpula lacrymans var. lacrymans S7.9]EGN93449.1 hypothetical protein SERLA73DRAFT_189623 [Serpula lacrymans var. lacrymans S7.3]EGO18828.1 hypothetical protein SERLADRAFT_480493 [Serpula lacrymans var. lacrymans S7.9]
MIVRRKEYYCGDCTQRLTTLMTLLSSLLYYISDYITKSTLPVHVGLDALHYTIKQNEKKFPQSDDTPESVRSRSLFTKSVNAHWRRGLLYQSFLSCS